MMCSMLIKFLRANTSCWNRGENSHLSNDIFKCLQHWNKIRFSDPNFAFYVKWCVINEEYQLGHLGKLNSCVYVKNQKNET